MVEISRLLMGQQPPPPPNTNPGVLFKVGTTFPEPMSACARPNNREERDSREAKQAELSD